VFLSLLVFAGIQSQPHIISIYFRNMTKLNNPFDHKILQDCLVKTKMNSEILPDGYANKYLRLFFFLRTIPVASFGFVALVKLSSASKGGGR